VSKKEENARMLDPNRFGIAASMATLPGGPPNFQMNNPDNVISTFGSNSGSAGSREGLSEGIGVNPYQDSLVESPALGTNTVMPMQNSGLPQQTPVGKKLNQMPYGMGTADMDQVTAAMAEGSRLGFGGFSQPVAQPSPMGYIGVNNPALAGGMPGGVNQQMPTELGLQGFPDVEKTTGLSRKGGMSTGSGRRG
jgi:hypothetical protein